MIRRPPISTRTDPLFPSTTLFLSPRPAVRPFLPAALRAGVRGRADNGPCRGSASLIPSEARDQVAAILAFVDGDGACDIAECGHGAPRSEVRRVGKECVSTCRSRWAPHHKKNRTTHTTHNNKKY